MTIGETTEDLSDSSHRGLGPAELVALGLLVVEGLVILGFIAAAIANQVQNSAQEFSLGAAHVWGSTLVLATEWSNPEAVAFFLIGPLALAVGVHRSGGDESSETRMALVMRLALALAVLTVLGGIVSVVGHVLQVSPSENWSSFFFTLGWGLGSVVLGLLVIVAVTRLAADMQIDLLTRQGAGGPMEEGDDR
jgi:hypothetical protein